MKLLSFFCVGSISFLICCGAQIEQGFSAQNVYPITDNPFHSLPKRFRTTQDFLVSSTPLEGLRELKASGSGQFCEERLIEIMKVINEKSGYQPSEMVIVDLRQESHGFINKEPVSWTDGLYNQANVGKKIKEIEEDEKIRLEQAYSERQIVLRSKGDEKPVEEWMIHSAQTEKELVESLGLTYIRLPVADHCRPSDEVVDLFIQNIMSLPSGKWLHFHCRGGSGRTTTFFALYDIMLNYNKVSLIDILKRQNLLGGKDLSSFDPKSYKCQLAMERLAFIENFYEYCKQNPDYSISWSSWIETRSFR